MEFKSSNPAYRTRRWENDRTNDTANVATMEGIINKTGILVLLTAFSTYVCMAYLLNNLSGPVVIGSIILNLVLALVIIFKPQTAPTLAPAYALVEGLSLGLITAMTSAKYPGVASQALLGTLGILSVMLFCYKFKIITYSEKLRNTLIFGSVGLMLLYAGNALMHVFGNSGIPFMHEMSPFYSIFCIFSLVLASFFFILDFEQANQVANSRAPKYMEWYCGFSILLTIIWVYLEMLRLLRSRK